MLSSRVISFAHALIVMISSSLRHTFVLSFTNCSQCCATEYEQPNQTWLQSLHSSISPKTISRWTLLKWVFYQRRKLQISYFKRLLVYIYFFKVSIQFGRSALLSCQNWDNLAYTDMHNINGKTFILYYYKKTITSSRGQQCVFKKNLTFWPLPFE